MKKSIWTLNDDQADINFCGKHMKAQKKKFATQTEWEHSFRRQSK